jgi:xanthine dehydrogenase accessory factor
MERTETDEILAALREARRDGRRAALATVVGVRGSAYRREGARMLIRDDGALTCMLSGGCLEPEVAEVARRVLERGQPELRRYDLSEDRVWGLGIGCGGTVDIYIEPIGNDPMLDRWLHTLERGAAAVLATVLASGARLYVPIDGVAEGSLGDASLDARVERTARTVLAASSPRAETHAFENAGGAADVFLDVSTPPPALVIFGAGHDAIPVVRLMVELGWAVTVVDARPAFTVPDRFPGATLVLAAPDELAARAPLMDGHTSVLVMNHHLERDQATLAFALTSGARSIGVLGPRSRYQRLLDGIRASGVSIDESSLARIRNPVGLDIGAESADEVALAIAAGLIAERRGFAGGMLDGVEGRIHDPLRRAGEQAQERRT